MLPTLLAISLGFSSPHPCATPDCARLRPAALPYEKIAREYAASIGLGNAKPEVLVYDEVLAKNFVHLRLGAFELHFPLNELERRAEDLRNCSKAVIDAELEWLDWLQASQPEARALREDLKALRTWVKDSKWTSADIVAPSGPTDALRRFHAPDALLQACERATLAMSTVRALGPPREPPLCQGLVILPSRKLFAQFVYFVGWIYPEDSALFWLDEVLDWSQCIFGSDMAVALEYAPVDRAPGDYTAGTAMSERGADVLQQQFMQIAMLSLLRSCYAERVPPAFLGGISTNLVIDVFGQVNTRVDGDLRGKITPAREVFVPGGASEGGVLAKNSADSRWRDKQGADHFLPTLRSSQKEGESLNKKVKNRLACFSVRSDDESERFLVAAPFLGAGAKGEAPPQPFQGEYAELIRSYKSCFLYWLQTKWKSSEKASREAFATLLKNLADPEKQGEFEQVFKDSYGLPLSNADADKNSIEGQFLMWLSHQK